MNDPTIFPVLIVSLIIAVIAWFQNMKWVSGVVLAGSIVYILMFGTSEQPVVEVSKEDRAILEHKKAELDAKIAIMESKIPETIENVNIVADTVLEYQESAEPSIPTKGETTFSPILVNEMVICREVSGRQPVGPGDRFPSTIETISCYTSIRNLNPDKQMIIHEWRLNGELMSRVPMELYFSYNWRCWSQVTLDSEREGTWTVAVKDTSGSILEETTFTVVSEDLY